MTRWVSAERGRIDVARRRSRGNSRHVDSGCERSPPGRGTTEGTPVARTRLPKKQARGDGLYLAVQRLLLSTAALAGGGAAREISPAIRDGLEPISDVPRDETRVSEDGGIRVTARQRSQKGDGGSGILGAEKASARGALRVWSSEAGDSRIATLTPLPPYPRERMGRRAASDGDEDACRLQDSLTNVRGLAPEARSSA